MLLLSSTIVRGIEGGIVTSVPPPAVIGYSNSPSWWPWIIAEEQDLFKKNDVNAELEWYDNYSDSVRDLNTGFIDANSQLTGDTLASSPQAIKGKVAVLLNSYSTGEDKIIVRDGINEIEDLRGKKIIAESASVDNQLLRLALDSADFEMSVEELKILNLETGMASAAFAMDHTIDAVVSFPPYSSTALSRKGSHELISSIAFPREISRMLVVSENMANEQPEIVEGLIEIWFEALDFMQRYPDKAREIIASRIGAEVDQVQEFQQQIDLVSRAKATDVQILAESLENSIVNLDNFGNDRSKK